MASLENYWGVEMAVFKKKDKREDADILSVLKEIRDRLPSKEERAFLAALSGVIANRGPCDAEGDIHIGNIYLARSLGVTVEN